MGFLKGNTQYVLQNVLFEGGPVWKSLYMYVQNLFLECLDASIYFRARSEELVELLTEFQFLESISQEKAKAYQTRLFNQMKAQVNGSEYNIFQGALDNLLMRATDEDLVYLIMDSIDFQVYDDSYASQYISTDRVLYAFYRRWNYPLEKLQARLSADELVSNKQGMLKMKVESASQIPACVQQLLTMLNVNMDDYDHLTMDKRKANLVAVYLCILWKQCISPQLKPLIDVNAYFFFVEYFPDNLTKPIHDLNKTPLIEHLGQVFNNQDPIIRKWFKCLSDTTYETISSQDEYPFSKSYLRFETRICEIAIDLHQVLIEKSKPDFSSPLSKTIFHDCSFLIRLIVIIADCLQTLKKAASIAAQMNNP